MIFYFSGTGNSRWIAEEIGEKIQEDACDIAELIKQKRNSYVAKNGECLGIVFPVYAWQPPELVVDFIKNITVQEDNFTFAIATCASEAGNSIETIGKYLPLAAGYSVAMPSNYIVSKVESATIQEGKIQQAHIKIAEFAQNILAKKKVFAVEKGTFTYLKSGFINWGFCYFAMGTKDFHTDKNCNGCGLCEKICPVECIKLVNNKPKWQKSSCAKCFGCINRCPQEAIQYGKQTQNKARYYLKK